MDTKRKLHILGNESGQSTVEYIMLIAVAIFIVTTVLRSDYFQDFFGADGKFATTFKQEVEFGYRNAVNGRESFKEPNYQSDKHPSYEVRGSTRFFGASDPYPK